MFTDGKLIALWFVFTVLSEKTVSLHFDCEAATLSLLLLDSLLKPDHQYCIAHSSWSVDPDCTSTLTLWHCH